MAEEKQPADVHEGSSTPPPPTGSKEDQRAAAALSNLDTNGEDDGNSKKEVDTEALGKAMQNLGVKDGQKQESKKVVKVNAADVTLLVCLRTRQRRLAECGAAMADYNSRSSSLSLTSPKPRSCSRHMMVTLSRL
jgi:hypothetical protein